MVAKVTVGINVRSTQQVCVVIEECILELWVWFVGMQFFQKVGGRKGQLASHWKTSRRKKKDDMFASMVQIGTVASDGVVKKRKTVSISCAPKDNEDRIDSGLHEAKGLGG